MRLDWIKILSIIFLLCFASFCKSQIIIAYSIENKIDLSFDRDNDYNLLFVFWGESNSGGNALDSDASESEIGLRNYMYIWDNVNNDGVDSLIINKNNLLGHYGINPPNDTLWHGWELETSNEVENNEFASDTGWLAKTGQGGSTVSQWDSSGTYYQKFRQRVGGIQDYLTSHNGKPTITYCMVSMGINDAIAETSGTVFYDSIAKFFPRMIAEFNIEHFYMTYIPTYGIYYDNINDTITALSNDFNYITPIVTSDAPMQNTAHWNYAGMKLIAQRMLYYIKQDFNYR